MTMIAFYLAVAVVVAAAAFLFAEWVRLPGAPAPDHTGAVALLAGLVWPVLAVGLVQWALVAAVQRKLRVEVAPTVPVRDDVRV